MLGTFAPAEPLRTSGKGSSFAQVQVRSCSCLQKWSKGKMKEKVNNQVLFDKVSSATGAAGLQPIQTARLNFQDDSLASTPAIAPTACLPDAAKAVTYAVPALAHHG